MGCISSLGAVADILFTPVVVLVVKVLAVGAKRPRSLSVGVVAVGGRPVACFSHARTRNSSSRMALGGGGGAFSSSSSRTRERVLDRVLAVCKVTDLENRPSEERMTMCGPIHDEQFASMCCPQGNLS